MRVMVIIKATKNSEAGLMPSEQLLTEMGRFNQSLVKAGVMEAGEGLHPSSRGKRVRIAGGTRTVIDGPFPAIGELISGFWVWKVASMEEAVTPELRAQEGRLRAEGTRQPSGSTPSRTSG